MSKIHPESGFVHLIFANTDDIYYTEHPLAMNFSMYITYTLKKQNTKPIDHVFFLQPDFTLKTSDKKSSEKYKNTENKNSWYNKLRKPDIIEINFSRLRKIMHDGKTALIVKADDLNSIVKNPQKLKLFEKIDDSKDSNLLIVVFKPEAESFYKFVFPEDDGSQSIFATSQFSFINKILYDEKALYIFPFEKLMNDNEVRRRVAFFNDLCYEDILRFVKCYFLSNVPAGHDDYKLIEWFAAVIYAYYNSTFFQCIHDIKFEDNPYRTMKIIEQSLKDNPSCYNSIRQLAKSFKDKYSINDNILLGREISDQKNVDMFFSKIKRDVPDGVYNIYSRNTVEIIENINFVIKYAYSCIKSIDLVGCEEDFDVDSFCLDIAKMFYFVDAERELKRAVKTQLPGPNNNATDALNGCVSEVCMTFKNLSYKKDSNGIVLQMLTYREGLYCELFFKAIKKHNDTIVLYVREDFSGNSREVSEQFRYCTLVKNTLKMIKYIAMIKNGASNLEDDRIQNAERLIDDICSALKSENIVSITNLNFSVTDFLNDYLIRGGI